MSESNNNKNGTNNLIGLSPSVPDTSYDLLVLSSLRRIIRAVDIYSRKLKSTFQITAPQLICLICIVEDSPLNIKSISEKVYLSPSTIVGILDRLEARGLIKRERDTKDRRIVNIVASKDGIKLAKAAPSPLQDNLSLSLKELPLLEQATIALSLKRVVDLMEVEKLNAAPMLITEEPINKEFIE